ncbi:MAG TPA: mechanosensitive ion channel family protein [Terriglobales bacterium]|nr:mechanosensitive ion channel family protein [Terriglobales bacterium]
MSRAFHFIFWILVLVVGSSATLAEKQASPSTTKNPPAKNPKTNETSQPAPTVDVAESGAPVEFDGRKLFTVYASVGGRTPEERAQGIGDRILVLARNRRTPSDAVRIQDGEAWTEILTGNEPLMFVTEADARAAARTRRELALENAEIIRYSVNSYRASHTWKNVLLGALYSVIATVALVSLLILLGKLRRRVRNQFEALVKRSEEQLLSGPSLRVPLHYVGAPLLLLGGLLRWAVILIVLETYVVLVLRFFPNTAHVSLTMTNWLLSQIGGLTTAAVNYLPNLLLVAVVCVVTYYVIRLNQMVFREIQDQRLVLRGFYPDWAEPTAKLVRALIVVLAAIVIFPYLPGAKSPAFQGITLFLGVLLSLGSSSAVANAVAGTILTYMRSFQVGDWVKIGETTGQVEERTLLVTRVRTPKNELITVPNATVMGNSVMNYSTRAKAEGVVFHTTVTIGYDAPWRTVHQLLIDAALATSYVRPSPRPFVLQTALNDFYVAYQINAYTNTPNRMLDIYSELHQNIQDKFNAAGLEINSPHYTALRDGNQTTIPQTYLSRNYQAPEFRVHLDGARNSRQTEEIASDFTVQDLDQLTRTPEEGGP